MMSRFFAFSCEYAAEDPKLLACCKKIDILRFMLAVSVTVSGEKNVFLRYAFGRKRVINFRGNFVDFKQNFSTVLSEIKSKIKFYHYFKYNISKKNCQ